MSNDAIVNRLIKEKILKVQSLLRIDNGMETLPPEDIFKVTVEAAVYHILTTHFLMSDTYGKDMADMWLEAVLLRVSIQMPDLKISMSKSEKVDK
jgi:hypothetical protein